MTHEKRKVCFVTGTRAEFGLMRTTLRAIRAHRHLDLQIIATGMHLDRSRGSGINAIRAEGFSIDRRVPWNSKRAATLAGSAHCTGLAIARIADALEKLGSDIVLVVGDRVEALAGAVAGHISGRVVAHVHGGDRAAGQIDDSLRHTITKLAHIHFPATLQSAKRIARLGEDPWRIHRVGSPGLDGIARDAAPRADVAHEVGPLEWRRYALLLLHPVDADEAVEQRRAQALLQATAGTGFPQIVIIYPNNDPGSGGIVRAWSAAGLYFLPRRTRPGSPGYSEGGQGRRPSKRVDSRKKKVDREETPSDRLSRFQSLLSPTAPSLTLPRDTGGGNQTISPSRQLIIRPDVPRRIFLGLLRDAAVLVGNSSSGIIEAASFGTPVVDVGPRQQGREHGANVTHVPYDRPQLQETLRLIWNDGKPRRVPGKNIYGAGRTPEQIAAALAGLKIDERLLRKLITY